MNDPTPLEMLLQAAATTRSISIGLPASTSYSEKRFPLTPEAAAVLVERGYSVRMQAGAEAYITPTRLTRGWGCRLPTAIPHCAPTS